MRTRFKTAVVLLVLAVCPAAMAGPRQIAQIPMLPLADGPHPDIEALVSSYWKDTFRTGGKFGFDLDDLRVGRIDLDGDDDPELVLEIDKPDWESQNGQPLLIATWVDHHWLPVGWGWAQGDDIFVTDEVIKGWHTLEIGKFLMRWSRRGYQREVR